MKGSDAQSNYNFNVSDIYH